MHALLEPTLPDTFSFSAIRVEGGNDAFSDVLTTNYVVTTSEKTFVSDHRTFTEPVVTTIPEVSTIGVPRGPNLPGAPDGGSE
jgi:hypothetical protein